MNRPKQLVVVAIFAALTCAGLHAQSLDMKVTIPFDFHAGDKLMPAGEYKVHGQDTLVILSKVDGRASVAVLTNSAWGPSVIRDARLDFHRYGESYFLTTVWSPFSNGGREVPQTSGEKELAKHSAPTQPAVIAASNKK